MLLVCLSVLSAAAALPTVDPGLFVISGVKTCGGGNGYCLLGSDCTLDQDFVADRNGGHCVGLKGAFTPAAHFVCCSDSKKANEVESGNSTFSTTKDPGDVEVTTEIDNLTTTPEESQSNENFAEEPTCEVCNSTVILKSGDGTQLCTGSHLGNGWILTSASCALRSFKHGMVSIQAQLIREPESVYAVKTIIVHENYKPASSNILEPESYNLGLLQLNSTLPESCSYCLPAKGQSFAGQLCTSPQNASDTESENCDSELETMQGDGQEEFLTIACSSAEAELRNVGDQMESGKPLVCGGHLVGIETSSGVGITLFTQLALYSDWIKSNMSPRAAQEFRL